MYNPEFRDWTYKRVAHNILGFYKAAKRLSPDVRALETCNPDMANHLAGKITLAVTQSHGDLLSQINSLALKNRAVPQNEWSLLEQQYFRSFLFPLQLSGLEKARIALSSSRLGKMIYNVAYSLLR